MANWGLGWGWGFLVQEAKEEGTNLGGANDVDKLEKGDGHDSPHDLPEARTNPLLPKRRKVKSTRYAVLSQPI